MSVFVVCVCVCVCMYVELLTVMYVCMYVCTHVRMYGRTYRIASNHGPGVYFFPAIFNQAIKQDRQLLSEETHAVYNL